MSGAAGGGDGLVEMNAACSRVTNYARSLVAAIDDLERLGGFLGLRSLVRPGSVDRLADQLRELRGRLDDQLDDLLPPVPNRRPPARLKRPADRSPKG